MSLHMPREKQQQWYVLISQLCLENSVEEVILDVTIDNKLTFDIHKMYEEKLVKNFVPCRDYLIIWKLTKNLFFIGMISVMFSGN